MQKKWSKSFNQLPIHRRTSPCAPFVAGCEVHHPATSKVGNRSRLYTPLQSTIFWGKFSRQKKVPQVPKKQPLVKFWSMAILWWSALFFLMAFWSSVAEGCVRVWRSKRRCRKNWWKSMALVPSSIIQKELSVSTWTETDSQQIFICWNFGSFLGNEVPAKLKISSLRKGGLPFNPTRKCLGLRTMHQMSRSTVNTNTKTSFLLLGILGRCAVKASRPW